MSQQVSRILSTVFLLAWTVIPALGQSTLSAKASSVQPQPAAVSADTDRVRDGLVGPVRRVRTEIVKVSNAGGQATEDGKRLLLETAEYDLKGNKTQNQYFPIAGSTLTGHEIYKYDDKGNISEMTLLGADGALISKEMYKYDADSVGNWIKMTTSVAVVENGKIDFEPTEFTYRTIFYYLDEKIAKMIKPDQVAQPSGEKSKSDNTSNKQTVASKSNAPDLPVPMKLDKTKIFLGPTASPEGPGLNGGADKVLVVLESEPPAPLGPKPISKPVSRGVLNGSAIDLPTPVYPDIARRMHAIGVVIVEVVIDENGKVISASAVSGPALLRDAAVQTAYRARFSPTKLSGQPVKVSGTINYNFKLAQ